VLQALVLQAPPCQRLFQALHFEQKVRALSLVLVVLRVVLRVVLVLSGGTEIEVSQRWALRQHSCHTLCPACSSSSFIAARCV
jgi:hypothetical protein